MVFLVLDFRYPWYYYPAIMRVTILYSITCLFFYLLASRLLFPLFFQNVCCLRRLQKCQLYRQALSHFCTCFFFLSVLVSLNWCTLWFVWRPSMRTYICHRMLLSHDVFSRTASLFLSSYFPMHLPSDPLASRHYLHLQVLRASLYSYHSSFSYKRRYLWLFLIILQG